VNRLPTGRSSLLIPTTHLIEPRRPDVSDFPEDLKYTTDHEWVRQGNENTVRVGVTSYAAEQLGDIVFVSLPTQGDEATAGDPCGELESTKSVSDIYCPVSGTVSAVNDKLDDTPEAVNNDPYGDGWLFEIETADGTDLDALLDADAYAEHVESPT
jgi:glycine cleavage system H protein